jgi:hypothetical protein
MLYITYHQLSFRVELYHMSVSKIKQENMLQSISINYKAKTVTVEDMLKQATFLKKLKFPFIFTVTTLFVLNVVQAVEKSKGNQVVPMVILTAYNVLNWLFCTGGFLIYGRRLVSLMPNHFSGRIRRLTTKLTLLSVSLYVSRMMLIRIDHMSCIDYCVHWNLPWYPFQHSRYVYHFSSLISSRHSLL